MPLISDLPMLLLRSKVLNRTLLQCFLLLMICLIQVPVYYLVNKHLQSLVNPHSSYKLSLLTMVNTTCINEVIGICESVQH